MNPGILYCVANQSQAEQFDQLYGRLWQVFFKADTEDLSQHERVVSEILLDLARRQTNNLSIQLARQLVAELGHQVPLLTNSHRSAGFAVLKAPDIPSALVEIGCLSNRDEERLLQRAAYQRKVANGLVRSINDYFDLVAKA